MKNKIIERGLLMLAVTLVIALLVVSKVLYDIYQDGQHPNSMVYGTWVEQNVAPYSADRFVLGEKGVIIDSGIVDTQFTFNGDHVEFNVGDEKRRYKLLNQQFTEMRMISSLEYQPVYRLLEKYKNNLR
ncbi:DUF2850 domain-containing protein [Vibrio ostreicida]|uniref:DUF2850 domain-containing protein n=1 Tax=Vibrio ostreicida TaxID=526588 RepID=A0ABT8BXK2_9VIBR|nr:DUF2850 domain-containing protein [Vibrio ostreicida]MDN3610808.1 DUF2850 domain-containing protein [Vibrio ostreicida]NPD07202.1 DUF2850 domain-containing protein [Vibrio ostreicida]